MTVLRARRFAIDTLFEPRSVAVLGETADGARVLANLREGGFAGPVWPDPAAPPSAALPVRFVADLAVITGPESRVGADLLSVAAAGCQVAIVTCRADGLAALASSAGLRVLGPSSFGVAGPAMGLNASLSHIALPAGHVALVTQSAALARAVIDWAGPNGVGFSHVAGIGGNADIGFGAVLDFLARDPGTKLILLDIRRVRARRAFISAARAASRLRPVVALRPGGRLLDETGRADAVFEAALNRAGVFTVDRFEAFVAAAETLSRSRPLRGETMAIVTNAIGPGRLAADAALRAGITLATLSQEAQASLTASLPADLIYGLVYAGAAAPTDVASIAAMISAVPGVGGVLVLLAPTGAGDAAAVESVIAAAHTAHLPVLTCVMGETTGAAHRRRLAEAGLPAFATPEQAVEAFAYLLRDRRARQAARELPASRVLDVAPDHDVVARIFAEAAASGCPALTCGQSLAVLSAYGIGTAPHAASASTPAACLTVHEDPTFGPAIGLALPAGTAPAYDLPPLNLALAHDLSARAGLPAATLPAATLPAATLSVATLHDAALADAAADALVRVSQLLVDQPQVSAIAIGALHLTPQGALAGDAAIRLHPAGQHASFAISPYPEQLAHDWSSHGQTFHIRPIRPEDAQAHAALVGRVPPEDMRFRFFTALRQVAPEQMARLTQIDYDREMAFIAVRPRDGATVGVARLVCEPEERGGQRAAEFAILVQPDSKGLGLARHLMDRLIAWARGRAIGRITGQVLADNHAMLGFVRHLGFTISRMPDEAEVVEAVLDPV